MVQIFEDEGPRCLHCGEPAMLVTGKEIYPHRPDLWEKPIWQCEPCAAYCGCHPGTTDPLGYPANRATRRARMILHEKRIDPLWKNRKKHKTRARKAVYRLLSARMGIPRDQTHTGMFTIDQCREAWRALEGVSVQNLVNLSREDA